MGMNFASTEWAAALASRLEHDAEVRTQAMTWVFGPIDLVLDADAAAGIEAACVRIDLHEGAVRSVHALAPASAGPAPFEVAGSVARWKAVHDASLDIVDAILEAKLRARGDMPTLVRHRALLAAVAAAAGSVETAWQDEREAAAASS